MKEKRILYAIGWVKDEYIEEMNQSQKAAGIPKRRLWLLAAAIALTMLLVGCAAVYFWLQDMGIGSGTYTRYHDDKGLALEEPVEEELTYLNFSGFLGSNSNKAFSEWYAFAEGYDPEGKYLTNEPDLPDIPNNYEWVYGCYTQEMMEKLDEIVTKYDMKLLDEWVPVQKWQSEAALQEGLGVATLLKPEAQAAMEPVQGMLYPPYNFDLDFDLRLTGADAAWTKTVGVKEYYYHKDYLPDDSIWAIDPDSFEQWTYTTADGVSLWMAMNQTGLGFAVCDRGEALQVVAVSGNTGVTNYPEPDQVPGRDALEQIAEAINFRLTFDPIDAEAMKPAMDAADAAYQAEHAYVEPVYAGFEDYLRENCRWMRQTLQYTYHDLNGDGEVELLLGYPMEYGISMNYVITLKDGQATEDVWDGLLCEDNVLMQYSDSDHAAGATWQYWKYTFAAGDKEAEFMGAVNYNADGSWQINLDAMALWSEVPATTQAEAEAFRAKFTPLALDWKSVDGLLLSDGVTMKEYRASLEKPLTQEELRQFYADWYAGKTNNWHTYYRIMDVNNDGVEDLLLSGDGEVFWIIETYRYGELTKLAMGSFYLCAGGVLERAGTQLQYPGIEIQEHEFFRFQGQDVVSLDYVNYNRSTGSWQTDLDGTTIPEAEAQAILAKYPRIDQEMRPISELVG